MRDIAKFHAKRDRKYSQKNDWMYNVVYAIIIAFIVYLMGNYILGISEKYSLHQTLPPIIYLQNPQPGEIVSENSEGHFPTVISVHNTNPNKLVFIISTFWGKTITREINIKKAPEIYYINAFDGLVISNAYYTGGFDENGNVLLTLKPVK